MRNHWTVLTVNLLSYCCQKHLIKCCETIYERDGINLFWSIKHSNEILNKFLSEGFKASEVSTYDFPHCILRYHITLLKINLLT